MEEYLKIVLVGDDQVGKTSICNSFANDIFPVYYIASFENYPKTVQVDGEIINLRIWDTNGNADYDKLRPLCYPSADCFMICFAVNSESSLENVQTKWCNELKTFNKRIPVILVGTKQDLRDEENTEPLISPEEGLEMKRKIKARAYFECSSKTKCGFDLMFSEAVRCIRSKNCFGKCILL